MTKRRGGKIELTTEEIVATLRRTKLPTVVIEGKDDLVVFRRLEVACQDIQLSVFPVNGRSRVLDLFDERRKLGLPSNISFAADKDMWVFDGVPTPYDTAQIALTDGYSIENDVYRDGGLEELMLPEERRIFERELEIFLAWYASAVCRRDDECLRTHPNEVLSRASSPGQAFGENVLEVLDVLRKNYASFVRGKSLVGLLMRQINKPGRHARYNKSSLLELVATRPGKHIERLFDAIRDFHSGQVTQPQAPA